MLEREKVLMDTIKELMTLDVEQLKALEVEWSKKSINSGVSEKVSILCSDMITMIIKKKEQQLNIEITFGNNHHVARRPSCI